MGNANKAKSQADRTKQAGHAARACCTADERFLVIIVNTETGEARTSKNLSTKDAVGVLAAMLDQRPGSRNTPSPGAVADDDERPSNDIGSWPDLSPRKGPREDL